MRRQLAFCLLLIVRVIVLRASTIEWIADGTAESTWHNARKWSLGRVPAAADDVVIADPGNYTIVVSSADVAVASLRVVDGAENFGIALEIRRRLTVAGPCTIGGQLQISYNGDLRVQSDVDIAGDVDLGGRLTGIGGKRTIFVRKVIAMRTVSSQPVLSNSEMTVSAQLSVLPSTQYGETNVQLENGASIVVSTGATATMTSASIVTGSGGTFVRNEGTIECRQSSGDGCHVATHLINDGNVDVVSRARLRLQSSTNVGKIYVDRYSRLTLMSESHVYFPEAAIRIDGTLETASGTSSVAARSLSIGRVLGNGGILSLNFSASGTVTTINSIEVTKGTVNLENTDSSATSLLTDVLSINGDGVISTSVDVKTKSLFMSSPVKSNYGEMIASSSVVVTDRWLWDAGTVSGPGTIRVSGSVEISQSDAGEMRVFLYVSTAIFNGAAVFRKRSYLMLGGNTRLTITQSGVVTFAAVGCWIGGATGHSVLDNWGRVQTATHYTGETLISVGEFNNYGRVVLQSEVASSLKLRVVAVSSEGSFEIARENTLTFYTGSVRGNRMSRIVGNGTLYFSESQAQLYNVLVQRLESDGSTVDLASSDSSLLTLTELTVRWGVCTLHSDLSVIVQSINVFGGEVIVSGTATAESIQMTSGTLKGEAMTIEKEFSWTGGTVSGGQVTADTLHVYTQNRKTLESVHLVVRNLARVQGYGMNVAFTDAAILEVAAGAKANVIGDVTFSSSVLSSAFIVRGDVNVMAKNFLIVPSLHVYGSMTLLNSDLFLKGASTSVGNIVVGLNSSLSLQSSLVLSESSRMSGNGELLLSYTSSGIQLYNVNVETIRVTTGSSTIRTNGNLTLIDVSGGTLEIADNDETEPVFIHRVTVSGTSSFVSERSVHVEELTVSGSGQFTASNGGIVTDQLQWISGWIKGSVFGQASLDVAGRLRIAGASIKRMQYVNLVIADEGTWRGYGNIEQHDGSSITVSSGAHFSVDTTSSVTQSGGLSSIVNKGNLTIESSRVLSVGGVLENYGNFAIQDFGSLRLLGHSRFHSGSLSLEENSILRIASSSSNRHVISSDCTVFSSNTSTLDLNSGFLTIDVLTLRGNLQFNSHIVIHSIEENLVTESLLLSGQSRLTLRLQKKNPLTIRQVTILSTVSHLQVDGLLTVQNLTMIDGTISGTGDITARKVLWKKGSISGSAISRLDVSDSFDLVQDTRKVVISRQLHISGVSRWAGSLALQQGATMTVNSEAKIFIESSRMAISASSGASVTNYGYIEHSPLTQLIGFLNLNVEMTNRGTIKALGAGGLVLTNSLVSWGVVEVASSNSSLTILSGNHVFKKTASLRGAGAVGVESGQLTIESGDVEISSLRVTSGNVVLSPPPMSVIYLRELLLSSTSSVVSSSSGSALKIDALLLQLGTANLGGKTNITYANVTNGIVSTATQSDTIIDDGVWYGGKVSGPGDVVVRSFVALKAFNDFVVDSGTTVVASNDAYVGGSIKLGPNARFVISQNATALLADQGALAEELDGSSLFVNYGTVKIADTFSLQTPLRNEGLVVVESGTVTTRDVTMPTGRIEVPYGAELKLTGNFRTYPDSAISGLGRLSTSGSGTVSSRVFDVSHVIVSGGTLNLDLSPSTFLSSIEIYDGILVVPFHSDVVRVRKLKMYGGKIESYAPVIVSDQLYMVSGEFAAKDRVDVLGEFLYYGGTVSGWGDGVDRFPFSVDTISIASNLNPSGSYVVSGKRLVVKKRGDWKGIVGSKLELSGLSVLEIAPGVVFNVSQSVDSSIEGNGKIVNRGIMIISTVAASPLNFLKISSLSNFGQLFISNDSKASVTGNLLCPINGSMIVAREAELQLAGTAYLSCSVTGEGALSTTGGGTLEIDEIGTEMFDIKALSIQSQSTVKIAGNFSCEELTISDGTLQGGETERTNVSITNELTMFGGSFVKVSVSSLGKSNLEKSPTIRSSSLSLYGNSAIEGMYYNTIVLLAEGATLRVCPGSNLTLRRYVSFSEEYSYRLPSTFINDGIIEVVGLSTKVAVSLPILNNGEIRAKARMNILTLKQVDLESKGSFYIVGKESQLKIISSRKSRISAEEFCDTCELYIANGEVELITNNTNRPALLTNVRMTSASLSLFGHNNATITSLSLEQSSRLRLQPTLRILRLTVDGSSFVKGSSSHVDTLVFRSGTFGSRYEQSAAVVVSNLEIPTDTLKYLVNCEMTVLTAATFHFGSLNLMSQSRLTIASSATATFLSTYVQINGNRPGFTGEGELVNKGRLRIEMVSRKIAVINVYFSNFGTVEVKSGDLQLSGASDDRGALIVDHGSSLIYWAYTHSSSAASTLNVQGTVVVRCTVLWSYTSAILNDILIQWGSLEIQSSVCVERVNVSGGTLKLATPLSMNVLDLSDGTLECSETVAVNGFARWTGGALAFPGVGGLSFNGETEIASGLSDSKLSIADGVCSYANCVDCLGDSKCVWFADGGTCTAKTLYDKSPGRSCQTWALSAAQCSSASACNAFQVERSCANHTQCHWCAPADSCLKTTDACPEKGVYWRSRGNGLWTDRQSWSEGRVPSANSLVFISIPRRLVVRTTGTVTVKSLTVGGITKENQQPELSIRHDVTTVDLTVFEGALVTVQDSLTWTGEAVIYGTILWAGPSLTGSGQLNVYGSFVLEGATAKTLDAEVRLHGRAYHSQGTVNFPSKKIFHVLSNASLSSYADDHFGQTESQIINEGTFRIASRIFSLSISPQLDNTGLIIVERNTSLQLTSAVVNGSVELREGGSLTVSKALFGSNAKVSGFGELSCTSSVTVESGAQLDVSEIKNSGTLTVSTPRTFKRLTLTDGSFIVRGSVNVTDLMHWTNGNIASATATSRLNVLGVFLLQPSLSLITEKKRLTSIDFVSYGGSTIDSGGARYGYVTIRTTGASRFILASGSYLDVASVVRFQIDVPLVNEGLLAFSGKVILNGGITNSNECLIRSSSTLHLRESNVFDSKSRLTVNGALLIDDYSSKAVINGALTTPINSISIAGGRLTLNTTGRVKSLTAAARGSTCITHSNIQFGYVSVGYGASLTAVGKLLASYLLVHNWASLIKLSDKTHDVDILWFGSGSGSQGCQLWALSGHPTLRVNEYFYIDDIYVSAVNIALGNKAFLHGANAKYFVKGAKIVVPEAAQVAVTTVSKPFLSDFGSQTAQIVNNGTLVFRTLEESMTSSTGHHVDIHFINNGICSFDGRAWITAGSESTGTIEILDGSRLDLRGRHTWRGKIWSHADSVISQSSSSSLEITGNEAVLISRLEIELNAYVTLDVSPSSLSLGVVHFKQYGTLKCVQNCTIDKSLVWTSGRLLMDSASTTITLPRNSTLQAVGGSKDRYIGSGSVIVQGAATFNTRYSLYVSGRFVIEGNADVYNLPFIYSWRGSGAVINRGRTTIHHGYVVQLNTRFENLNELNVRGTFRLYSSEIGWSRGSIRIPLASGTFISAVQTSFELANTSTISGRGTIEAERGALTVFSDLSTSRGFFGTVRVSGGTLRISSTYVNLTRVEVTRSSSSQLFLTVDQNSRIDNVVQRWGTFTATSTRGSLLTIGVLELYRATMTGDIDIRVTTFIWTVSSRVMGRRTITVVDHLQVRSYSHLLSGVHLIVANTAVFGGSGDFDLYSAAIIEIAPHANASVPTSRTFSGGRGNEMVVDGELRCGGELAVVVLNVELTNNGRLSVEKGTLRLSDTNIHRGIFEAAPGTVVELGGSTTFAPTSKLFLADSTVLSTSAVNLETETQEPTFNSLSVSSGTFRVDTPMGLLVRTEMKMTSGTVRLKSRLRTPRLYMEKSDAFQTSDDGFVDVDELHWLSGTIYGRGGASSPWFVVRRLARLTSTTSKKIQDGAVAFKGRATLTETINYLTLLRATLVNDGTFVIDSAGTTVYSTNGRFVNNGTFVVDVGDGKALFHPEFGNEDGWITVKSGQLQLLHRSSHSKGGGLELEPEASVQFSGSDHIFDDSSVVRCKVDSVVYVTSGRLGIYANSSNVTFSQLDVSGGEVVVDDGVALRPFSHLRVARGLVRFNASTRIQKATLAGGTVVVPQRFQIDELLMSSSSTIKGGRPKSRALLTVRQFVFSRGTIDAETSTSGRHFFINVTDALAVASLSGTCIVRRTDLISHKQAVVSSSSSSGLSLEQDARFVNSRHGTTTLAFGRIGGTSTLLNYGLVVVETSGSLEVFNLNAELVNTGGQVSVNVGQLQLNRGGRCNGTGGRVYVAEGARLLVGSNTFQCRPDIIVGRGSMEIVWGGVLRLTSPSPIVLPLTVSRGGRIEIPRNAVGATFVATLTINGGTMQVDGMANVTSDLSLVSGSLTGSGIVVIAETGRMTTEFSQYIQSFSIANQVQNFGDILLKEPIDVSSNGRLRNEKTGRVTIVGVGGIVGAGIVENLGLVACRLNANATCQLATNFRNYKRLRIETGRMDLTSSPWLVDGSTLDGPGRLATIANLRVGGRVNVDWTVTSDVAVDGPLFSTRTCTWTTGVLSSSSSGACTAYSPQSSRVLTPLECKEDFFVNEGLLLIDGAGTKQIDSDLALINRGVVEWKAGSPKVAGSLLIDANSTMNVVAVDVNKTLYLYGDGHVTNKGLLSVVKSAMTISVDFQNMGTISLDDATLTIHKRKTIDRWRTFTNQGLIIGFGAISSTFVNAGTVQSFGVRPLALDGDSSFSQTSEGTLTVTVIESDGRFVSSLLDCTRAKSVSLAGTVHVVWNATDALLPGEEGPPVLTFGSGVAVGTFDAVTVEGGGGMVLVLAYKSTSVVLKRN